MIAKRYCVAGTARDRRAHTNSEGSFDMGSVIGDILPQAIAVAISVAPIIAVVLLLSTTNGKGKAFGFLIGWVVGLGIVGTAVLLVAEPAGASTDDGPAAWVGWLILALGVALIFLAIKGFLGRPKDGVEPPMPKWMAAIDQFGFGKCLGMGFILAAVNPKNLALTVAAAAAISAAGLSSGSSFVVLAVFVVIGTIGLAIPIAIFLLAGKNAVHILDDLRHWLALNNTAIMSVVFLLIGAKLIGDGVSKILG